MDKENIQWVRCRLVIELAGFPEAHINDSLNLLAEKFEENSKGIVKVLEKSINEAKKVSITKDQSKEAVEESKVFSGFIELEVDVAGLANLIGIVFDWLPSSVEIISTENFAEDAQEIAGVLNDLAGKLHKYDSIIKMLKAENTILRKELAKYKPENKP